MQQLSPFKGDENDERFMRRAIELARTAEGWTNPNPLVGAVIVRDGRIIGEGCHELCGSLHAERNALKNATEPVAGATIYVTLEPCSHTGKQPPCADALIESGLARVVVGSRDPNPLVHGAGNERLRAAGIDVVEDFLRSECDALNSVFFHYITCKRPYVVAKWAMTMDGKIAAATGDAKWVSGEESRADCHDTRHRLAAIMVGIGTVLADDPSLTSRREGATHQPIRVVCDTNLRIPMDCALVNTVDAAPTLVVTASTDVARIEALTAKGVQVLQVPAEADASGERHLKPAAVLEALGFQGIDSVLLEGGSALHGSFFADDLVDEVQVYVAPKVLGGAASLTPVGGQNPDKMADAHPFHLSHVENLGDDVKLTYVRNEGDADVHGNR